MKRITGLLLVVVLLTPFLASQGNEDLSTPSIWADPLPNQPLDRVPFRPIQVPAWVQQITGCGYTLSTMDTKSRQEAVNHGVKISEMGFVDPFYPYYNSKLLKKRSPHVPLDRIDKEVAEYKKLGIRILGVYPPCLQGEVYENHPEWRRISAPGQEIPQVDMKKYPHGGMLCLLGPYGDFFIEVLAEILTLFPDVDAFSFDGLHHGGCCYCKHCQENYRTDTGQAIPRVDMEDPAFRRYQHWADRRMEDLVRRMQNRLKKIKPEVALITWTTNAGRFGHFLDIPRNMPSRMNLLLDAPDQEFWLDETNRGNTIVPAFANAYIWATTNHRVAFSEPYLMSHGNPYGKDSFPAQEILRRMLLAITYGASPSIAVAQPSNLQKSLYDCMDAVVRRKPWMTNKKPEPWAALVMSDNTRNFYGRSAGKVEERYLASVFGTFRAAVEEHLPVTLINDWNLNSGDLEQFKVLILPNTACLDHNQMEAIDRFVSNGGGLVASLDTSLFDEFGDPRTNFGLSQVLGVNYLGLPREQKTGTNREIDINFAKSIGPDYWDKRKLLFDFKLPMDSILAEGRLKTYLGDQSVTFKGPAIIVKPMDDKANILGTLVPRDAEESLRFPAIISRNHGKGRVVYFAAGFDSAYYLYSYPYQRLLLRQAIDQVASSPKPVNIQAPMCVHSTIMRQSIPQSEKLIVHLYNDVNSTGNHAFSTDDVPLREEVVPIHDIRISFQKQYRIRKIVLQPEGIELPIDSRDSTSSVTVPRLEIHSMVVVDLK